MGLGLGLIDCNENSVATNLFSPQNLGPQACDLGNLDLTRS